MEVGQESAAWRRADATLFLRSMQKTELFPVEWSSPEDRRQGGAGDSGKVVSDLSPILSALEV